VSRSGSHAPWADDNSTRAIRSFLRDRGHHVHAWRLGGNTGREDVVAGLVARLRALRERHERRVDASDPSVTTCPSDTGRRLDYL